MSACRSPRISVTIARQYGVVAYDVARLNDLKPPYIIHVGRSLILPDAGRLRTAPVSSNTEGVTLPSSSRVPTTTTRSSQPPASETTAAPAASAAPVPRSPVATGKGFQWPVRGRTASGFRDAAVLPGRSKKHP